MTTPHSQPDTAPLELLEAICDEIFERWDKDQRSGKLLLALAGKLPNYRADVTAIRSALSRPQCWPEGSEDDQFPQANPEVRHD